MGSLTKPGPPRRGFMNVVRFRLMDWGSTLKGKKSSGLDACHLAASSSIKCTVGAQYNGDQAGGISGTSGVAISSVP